MIKGFEKDQTVENARNAINGNIKMIDMMKMAEIDQVINEKYSQTNLLSQVIFLVVDSVRAMATRRNEYDLIKEGIETRYINDPFFNIYISTMFTKTYTAMRSEKLPEITFTDVYRRLAESNPETGDKTPVSEVKKAALKYLELFAD